MRIDSAELSPKDDDVLGCVEWALDISFLGEFSLSPSAFLLRPLSESFLSSTYKCNFLGADNKQ